MTRPNKLGLTGITLLILSATPPYENWREPINAALVVAAFIFGYLAATQGSRWWSLLCAFILASLGLLLWVGFHAV